MSHAQADDDEVWNVPHNVICLCAQLVAFGQWFGNLNNLEAAGKGKVQVRTEWTVKVHPVFILDFVRLQVLVDFNMSLA
jgi:hypothetical protein